jgi:predicted phage terminase large subunit-like protein
VKSRNRRLDRLADSVHALPRPARPERFGVDWLRHYLPTYASSPPADFHQPLTAMLGTLHEQRGTKTAIIAPREGAKSTIITLGYVVYAAIEAHERYILILSDSADQAAEKLLDIRREIDGNQQLADDYPDACGVGPSWRNDRVELRNGVVIQAIGRKGRIRGRRNRQDRPSLVIFDDVENNAIITSEAERSATWRWATREVIPAGTALTNFLSVGSALHRECAAVRLGTLAGWRAQTHRAIHAWPDRMELWEEWERLATNLADDARAETARAYYEANREAMDAGARLYWPDRWPLYAVMQRRAEIGAAAFDTEYQGVPSLEGLCEWPPEFFDRKELWFDQWPDEIYLRVQSLDPSKGTGSRTSDDQAHIQAALAKDGNVYVEAKLVQEPIDKMIRRAIDMAAEFQPLAALVVENNDGLGMAVNEFETQIAATGRVVPLQGVIQHVNKEVRIRRLGIYFARGRIRFRNTMGTRKLVDQLRDFPNAEHDDGPDALELAVRALEDITNGRT